MFVLLFSNLSLSTMQSPKLQSDEHALIDAAHVEIVF